MEKFTYLKEVRNQYENYPYPRRNPEDEKKRILDTTVDTIGKINHYCYKGKQDFNNFRVLIAGGGTGDSLIYLAEQLIDRDAEIIYLDISQASMEVAKKRAEVRRLNNIKWFHGSLLDLSKLNIGKFDYINCTGVLHHLKDPSKGLVALRKVLKEDGCMGLMVYGKYGRTGVYHMQEAFRLINQNELDMEKRVDNASRVLRHLPKGNWFANSNIGFLGDASHDVGVYDLFLHSQDRSYDVLELYDFIENARLNIVEFQDISVKLFYEPSIFIRNKYLLDKIKKKSKKEQQAIAELLSGRISKHTFFVSRKKDTIASLEDLDNIPYFVVDDSLGMEIYEMIIKNSGKKANIKQGSRELSFIPKTYTGYVIKYINGERSLREIFDRVRQELNNFNISDEDLLNDFKIAYDGFVLLDMLLLRDKSIKKFTPIINLKERVLSLY